MTYTFGCAGFAMPAPLGPVDACAHESRTRFRTTIYDNAFIRTVSQLDCMFAWHARSSRYTSDSRPSGLFVIATETM